MYKIYRVYYDEIMNNNNIKSIYHYITIRIILIITLMRLSVFIILIMSPPPLGASRLNK